MPQTSKKRKITGGKKRSGEKPSTVLRRMSCEVSADSFVKLLENHLYPALDQLSPDAHSHIIERLGLAQQEYKAAKLRRLIDYDCYAKNLKEQVSALLRDVERNGDDGYEDQGMMMYAISEELLDWLPTLWQVGVEEAAETSLVRKALLLCVEVVRRVENCGSPTEFSETGFELCIEDAAGNVIYKENRYIMQSIAWIWKELLVSVASRNGRIEGILSNIKDVDLSEDVFNYLKEDVEDKETDDQSKWNGHWSPAMKIAARKVLDG